MTHEEKFFKGWLLKVHHLAKTHDNSPLEFLDSLSKELTTYREGGWNFWQIYPTTSRLNVLPFPLFTNDAFSIEHLTPGRPLPGNIFYILSLVKNCYLSQQEKNKILNSDYVLFLKKHNKNRHKAMLALFNVSNYTSSVAYWESVLAFFRKEEWCVVFAYFSESNKVNKNVVQQDAIQAIFYQELATLQRHFQFQKHS